MNWRYTWECPVRTSEVAKPPTDNPIFIRGPFTPPKGYAMQTPFSATVLATNHLAELQRHAKSARLERTAYLDRERMPRILRHWTNR